MERRYRASGQHQAQCGVQRTQGRSDSSLRLCQQCLSNAIDVYNVYTATLVRTIPNLGGALGDMAISPNGDYLYAYDTANAAIVKVDLRSMAKVANWQLGRSRRNRHRA
ncbi:hypothetical protein LP420_21295 [Massilia sp. B-10]|nr:hypothetical protein LP420_21295 [Massilia sp. B-10]